MRLTLPLGIVSVGCVLAGLVVFGCGGGGGGGGGNASASTTATTSSASASGTTAGTIFSANEIVYGLPNADGSTFNVDQIKPDGSSNATLLPNISTDISLFAQVPGSNKQFVFAADLTGANLNFGIYISSNLSTVGATTLVAPAYSQVSSLAVTADGSHIVYSAIKGDDPTVTDNLFSEAVKGGTPVLFGPSDGSTVSPADSNTIAYVAPVSSGGDQVFTRSLASGAAGAVTQVTSNAANHLLPAFNRTGTQLAYWEQTSTKNTLFIETLGLKTLASLPNPNLLFPLGEAFSADGTQVAIAADANLSGQILTQPVDGGASPTLILSNATQELGNYGVYWTDATGRGTISSIMPSSSRRRRADLAFFLHGR